MNMPVKAVMRRCNSAFVYVMGFSAVVNILMLTVPLYMLQIYDRVLSSHSKETLLYLTLLAMAALAVFGLIDTARNWTMQRISVWLDQKLSPEVLKRCPDERLRGNNYAGQALRDVTTIRQFLSSPGVFSLFDFPWIPVYLIVIYFFHFYLGLIATLGVIVLFIIALMNDIYTRPFLGAANEHEVLNQATVDKALNNVEAIQAMGMLPQIVHRWFGKNTGMHASLAIANRRGAGFLATSKTLRLMLQIMMLGGGAYLVLLGEITPGVMIVASIISARALQPIESAISTWKQFRASSQCYQRLRHFLEQPPLRTEGIDLPEPTGVVTVENLSYLAPGLKKPILQGVHFLLPAGKNLAIVGQSGAGKSTLARIILGILKPTQGFARLDGADVFDWKREQFGHIVGYLPQDVELFADTIKANIARMGEVDEQKVIEAAQFAGAHELILRLNDGYDFKITQHNLSGGQRQRIALARAFYGNPKLVILDEPNSNLDSAGTKALIQTIEKAKKANITVIFISHHMDLLNFTDSIILLDGGQLRAGGPRDEMLKKLKEMSSQ